ncbi:MAG: NAD(P)-dependent oxidoreductase [Bacteroidales bacterium]|jgi:dTDP-6-deoxy-L-talose 4-dehydrogenase (NAD+)|nr:NAD(P)-dependent oxidoreductase [Bacteroidales bacterium]
MSILVTGATGFIGRRVVEYLLSLGCSVIATSRKPLEYAKKILPFNDDGGTLNYISKNLNDREENYYSFFGKPKIMIHLSWEGLLNYNDLVHIERNLPVNYYFIKNMIQNGLPDVTITGTCFEYGLQYGCLDEGMDTRPVTNYALAKDTLRKFIQSLKYDFNFKWLRLFYLYGSGQGEQSLHAQLEAAVKNNEKIFNLSMGEQLRDYLPVDTATKYIVKLALQNNVQGIINCCSGKPISIRRFVENFFNQRNYMAELNLGYYPYAEHEPLAFWGNTEKMIYALGDGTIIAPPPRRLLYLDIFLVKGGVFQRSAGCGACTRFFIQNHLLHKKRLITQQMRQQPDGVNIVMIMLINLNYYLNNICVSNTQ